MPDSIQEQIVKKVKAELETITTANGYDNTIASVQRLEQDGINLGAIPTLLVKEGETLLDFEKSTHTSIRRTMELLVVIATRTDPELESRSGGEVLNSIAADVEKKLGLSSNWSGLALWTEPPHYLEVELDAVEPHLSRGIRAEIVFETARTDPFTQ